MGSFFDVMGGGGSFPKTPSHPTNAAVARFLRDKAGIPEAALKSVRGMSVAAVIRDLTRLQGCQLWRNSPDASHTVSLSAEQVAPAHFRRKSQPFIYVLLTFVFFSQGNHHPSFMLFFLLLWHGASVLPQVQCSPGPR
jgi:hypothetical protein